MSHPNHGSDIISDGRSDAGGFESPSSGTDESGLVRETGPGFLLDQPGKPEESSAGLNSGTDLDLLPDTTNIFEGDPLLFDYMNPIGEPPSDKKWSPSRYTTSHQSIKFPERLPGTRQSFSQRLCLNPRNY